MTKSPDYKDFRGHVRFSERVQNIPQKTRWKRVGQVCKIQRVQTRHSCFMVSKPYQLLPNRVPSWGHIFPKTLGKFSKPKILPYFLQKTEFREKPASNVKTQHIRLFPKNKAHSSRKPRHVHHASLPQKK